MLEMNEHSREKTTSACQSSMQPLFHHSARRILTVFTVFVLIIFIHTILVVVMRITPLPHTRIRGIQRLKDAQYRHTPTHAGTIAIPLFLFLDDKDTFDLCRLCVRYGMPCLKVLCQYTTLVFCRVLLRFLDFQIKGKITIKVMDAYTPIR
jgi:hypothetical protein